MSNRTAPENDEKWLTVIVAAYNVQQYIRLCLESVLCQRHVGHISLIVIDDGSTDATANEIFQVRSAHPEHSIKPVTQPNRGLSEARNAGLMHATTPYVVFLDGDDVWLPRFSDEILPLLWHVQPDIVEFNAAIIDEAGLRLNALEVVPGQMAGTDVTIDRTVLHQCAGREWHAWARVYRRSLFDGIQFPPGRYFEDAATIPMLYLRARTLSRLGEPLYGYRRRAGSITAAPTLQSVRDIATNAEEALARCAGSGHEQFWLLIAGKSLRHACLEAAKVDAPSFLSALRIIRPVMAKYRAHYPRHGGLPSWTHLALPWRIYADRGIFHLKRTAKRILRSNRLLGF